MENDGDGGGGTANSGVFQLYKAETVYPKKRCTYEDDVTASPIALVCGESPLFLGRSAEAVVGVSDYRFFRQQKDASITIPLGIIELTEVRENNQLWLLCKDCKSHKITFNTAEKCLEWQKRINNLMSPPKELACMFPYIVHAWAPEEQPDIHNHLKPECSRSLSYVDYTEKLFDQEVNRMKFDMSGPWRVSIINKDYAFCGTYPRKLIVPGSFNDNLMEDAARFRSARRIPAVVYRHTNGAVIARCSQPEVGILGWRSNEDEDLVKAIAEACAFDNPAAADEDLGFSSNQSVNDQHSSGDINGDCNEDVSIDPQSLCNLSLESKARKDVKKVLIVDARTYTSAMANRTRGGGCECIEYYHISDIQFMSLANIHSVRGSQQQLRLVFSETTEKTSYLTNLDSTKWVTYISGLIKAAVIVTQSISVDARPVLVHCSDGWDRTPQITGLAQILLDPFYRTFEGFPILVEREWIEFGHKFADRCGVGMACEDLNERCPIFLQWLDCIFQVANQFHTAFEFNIAYLVKLGQHVYSNLFGNFLCNTSRERTEANVSCSTYSIWNFLDANKSRYVNYLYRYSAEVLAPSPYVKDLDIWRKMYTQSNGRDYDELIHSGNNSAVRLLEVGAEDD